MYFPAPLEVMRKTNGCPAHQDTDRFKNSSPKLKPTHASIAGERKRQLWPSGTGERYTAVTRTHHSHLGPDEPHGRDFEPEDPDPNKYLDPRLFTESSKTRKPAKQNDAVKSRAARC